MTFPVPLSPRTPASPMKDGRSPRIHLSLMIWTLLLIALVLVEIRHLPPGLTVLLVPYLALMARHWVGRLRQPSQIEPAMPRDDVAGSPPDDEPDDCADSLGSDGCSSSDDYPSPTSPPPTEEPAPPPSRRNRVRRRPRTPEAEPPAASWMQIQPGRFVRVEELQPGDLADAPNGDSQPNEFHGATPLDEPEATLEAVSIPSDDDTDLSESRVRIEVPIACQDAAGATTQPDR